jgi:hypothetical protein
MMDYGTLLNKYMQPLGSPVDNTNTQTKYVPWQWGVQQGISTRKVRSSYAYSKQFAPGTLIGTITGGTMVANQVTGGSINNFTLQNGTHSGVMSGQGTINLQ